MRQKIVMIITSWVICLCIINCGSHRHKEALLAREIYSTGTALVPLPSNDTERQRNKENAPKAIPYFKDVIKRFPHTDYADLSYVQLGLCHEYLEHWDEAEKAYEALIRKYTDGGR